MENLITVPHIMAQPPRRSLLLRAQKSMGRSMLNLLATPHQSSSVQRRRSSFMGTSKSGQTSLRWRPFPPLSQQQDVCRRTRVNAGGRDANGAQCRHACCDGVSENDVERGGCAFSYFFQVSRHSCFCCVQMPRSVLHLCHCLRDCARQMHLHMVHSPCISQHRLCFDSARAGDTAGAHRQLIVRYAATPWFPAPIVPSYREISKKMTAKGMGRAARKFDHDTAALQMSTSRRCRKSSSRSTGWRRRECVKKSSLSWSPSSSDAARRSFKGVSLTRRSNSDCTSASDDQMKHKISSPGRREFPDRTDGKVCKPARDADGQPIRASSPNRAASPIRAPLRVNINIDRQHLQQ